jgi:two-component system, OmpR family, response regulator QseB
MEALMNRILIVEDESRIVSFLEKGLKANGFATTVAQDAQTAIDLGLTAEFDLMLLDLGLSDQDGLDVLMALRGQGVSMPIIILTARDDLEDKVTGFEEGADDYVVKPFRFEELLARVRTRLRTNHTSGIKIETVLQVGLLQLDLKTRQVVVDGREIDLPTKEFMLLETLMRHPRQVMSRQQLLDRIWGYDYEPGSNIVDVYIGYLRKKLGDNLIETVRGVGYRLIKH